ncbi:hypothetical protein FRC18_001311 [Serendipita sp. 400]|nr:hypothetical protein FRC18_001311 [Serendipita sp. 400]
MVHQDWTVVYTTTTPSSSSSSSSSSTTPLSSPFPSPTVDAHPFLLPVHITLTPATTTTSNSNSNNVSYVSSHPITTTTTTTAKGTNTRPTLSRRNSPAENGVHAHNPLLSLVRPHEPIEIPIPPSLRAKKGMRSSSFEGTTTLKPSSFSSSSSSASPSSYGSGSSGSSGSSSSSFGGRRAASAWYDYDEFGDAGSKAVAVSLSNLSLHELPVPAGPCPVPRLPPSPLLHPTTTSTSNMTPTQKYQACSPVPLLVLPGPVLRPTTTAAATTSVATTITRVSWA